ncbi:MAG: arginase family protein, partial [Acidobacteria bacterium]|nr:arginase family protein [Acidobacteriota bacterium]
MSFDNSSQAEKIKKVGIIGVPIGYGAGQKGSELGVTALRLSDIQGNLLVNRIAELGIEVKDYGDVEIVKPNYVVKDDENPKYLDEWLASYKNISKDVKKILRDDAFPVILGGDHSVALGTVSAVASFYRAQEKEIGLIWLDAHAD